MLYDVYYSSCCTWRHFLMPPLLKNVGRSAASAPPRHFAWFCCERWLKACSLGAKSRASVRRPAMANRGLCLWALATLIVVPFWHSGLSFGVKTPNFSGRSRSPIQREALKRLTKKEKMMRTISRIRENGVGQLNNRLMKKQLRRVNRIAQDDAWVNDFLSFSRPMPVGGEFIMPPEVAKAALEEIYGEGPDLHWPRRVGRWHPHWGRSERSWALTPQSGFFQIPWPQQKNPRGLDLGPWGSEVCGQCAAGDCHRDPWQCRRQRFEPRIPRRLDQWRFCSLRLRGQAMVKAGTTRWHQQMTSDIFWPSATAHKSVRGTEWRTVQTPRQKKGRHAQVEVWSLDAFSHYNH